MRDGKTLGTYTYDSIGYVGTSTDANNVTLSYQYNTLGHLTKAVYPDSTYEEIIYVCCNLPGLVRDRSGKITYYDYDALKRLIRVQDAAGNTASYQYDADGNMLKLIDGKGNQTLWSYDASGRAIRKTYADQHYQQYAYTNGLLSATQNEKGDVTHYQYDNDAKLTKIDYPNTADVTFSYDGLDRLSSMTDGLGTTGYSYDALDEISSIDGPWANDTLSYAYDALGRETGVGLDGTTVSTYGYDDLGRLSGLNSLAGNFTYNYAGDSGLLSQINFPNGAKSTFTYDALERLTQVQSQTSSAANIAKFAYTLDNRDIRTSVEKTYGSDPLRHVDYGYDTVNQLTSAVSTETPPAVNKQWSYDAMGNRTQHVSTISTGSTGTATYATNRLNQITHITTVADGVTKERSFTYDADGNTTQVTSDDNSSKQYTYDDADRLSSVVYKNDQGVNVSKSTYTYDGFSRLRIITKYTWNTGSSAWTQQSQKKFVYDGMQVIQERDGDDNVVANNIWDGNIGGLEARIVYDINTPTNPPQKYFYHYDGSGNVTAVTDDSQATVATYDYDAYGNLLNSSGTYASQNPWRFSTKYYDDGSGLYYYGYRFYSPGLGKWINRDPIGENGGVNLYGFVYNEPSNYVDDFGMLPNYMIDPCAQIKRDIGNTLRKLREELGKYDEEGDATKQYPYRGAGKRGRMSGKQLPDLTKLYGHRKEISDLQNRLRNLIRNYNKNGCGGGPNGKPLPYSYYELANREIPTYGIAPPLGPRPAPVPYPYYGNSGNNKGSNLSGNAGWAPAAGAILGIGGLAFFYGMLKSAPAMAPG